MPGLIRGLGVRRTANGTLVGWKAHTNARRGRCTRRAAVPEREPKRLAAVLALAIALLLIKATAGFLTRSLALLADATHMLADVGA